MSTETMPDFSGIQNATPQGAKHPYFPLGSQLVETASCSFFEGRKGWTIVVTCTVLKVVSPGIYGFLTDEEKAAGLTTASHPQPAVVGAMHSYVTTQEALKKFDNSNDKNGTMFQRNVATYYKPARESVFNRLQALEELAADERLPMAWREGFQAMFDESVSIHEKAGMDLSMPEIAAVDLADKSPEAVEARNVINTQASAILQKFGAVGIPMMALTHRKETTKGKVIEVSTFEAISVKGHKNWLVASDPQVNWETSEKVKAEITEQFAKEAA